MCKLCDQGIPQNHSSSRRDFLKASAATGVAAAGLDLFAARPAAADNGAAAQRQRAAGAALRHPRRRGDVDGPGDRRFPQGRRAGRGQEDPRRGAEHPRRRRREIDARGKIVMPGFIDTHHHQFETALRSFLADGLLFNDGHASRSDQLLPVHPRQVRAGLPAAGRLHQRAVRLAQPARRGRHDGPRHLADPPLAAAFGRRHQGHSSTPGGAPSSAISRGARLAGIAPGNLPGRRAPHQEAVLLVQRPAR